MSGESSLRIFFDTNILVYTDDDSEPFKQAKALELLEAAKRQQTGVISLQVLQEYFANVTRKLRIDPAHGQTGGMPDCALRGYATWANDRWFGDRQSIRLGQT